MEDSDKNIVKFQDNLKYKVGAVTYDVTVHFYDDYDDRETLKAKVSTLLTEDIRKSKNKGKC